MKDFQRAIVITILPIIAGFIDIINYYPNGDAPGCIIGKCEPRIITFSLINYLITLFLILIYIKLDDIYNDNLI